MTDVELVRGISQRNEQALEQLQEKYGAYCESIARKILGNDQEIQEVMNDVWLQIWERTSLISPLNLKAYLAKTVRNSALHFIEYHNAQKRSGICVQLDELSECIPDRFSNCDAQMLSLRNSINQFLRGLSSEQRQMFVRRYWYGDSVQEIGERFHCSGNRVGVILCRCRKKLKKQLEKEELWI